MSHKYDTQTRKCRNTYLYNLENTSAVVSEAFQIAEMQTSKKKSLKTLKGTWK